MNQDCSIELNASTSNHKKPFLLTNTSNFGHQSFKQDLHNPAFDMKVHNECNSLNNLEGGMYTVMEDPLVPSSVSLNEMPETEVFSSNLHSEIRLNININSPLPIAGRQLGDATDRQDPFGNQLDTTVPMQTDNNTQNRNWSIHEEAKNVLQRVSELYMFIMGVYILSILILKGFLSCYCLFGFVIAVCSAQAVRSMKFSPDELFMNARQRRAKYFKALDWTIASGFLLVAALRIEVIDIQLTPFVVPGFVNAILFYIFCDVHNSFIRTRTLTLYKLLFWGQVLLISMKIDGSIDNWAFVFVALFYTFVFFMSVSVGFFILAFSYVCQNCHMDGFDFNVVGLLWDFLNALFSWVWGFSLLGLIEELKNHDGTSILLPGLIAGVIHCTLLIGFTVMLRSSLLSYLSATLQLILNVEDTPVTSHSFETIKGTIPYLMKISPTYFMVMNDNFRNTDKARAEGCKKQIKEVKKQRKQSKPTPKRIKVQAGIKKDVPEYKSATIRLESKKTLKGVKSGGNGGLVTDNTPGIRDVNITNLCYSDDDAQVLDQVQKRAEKVQNNNEENEQTCMICCMNAPNAVFMRCGHGGVCYSCALETWKKGDKCALCRQPIDEILKVTLVNRVNVAKVIEGTKKYPTITSLEELPE